MTAVALIATATALGACTQSVPVTTPSPLASSSGATSRAPDVFDVAGSARHLVCRGAGAPIVVLLAGARDDTSTWDGLVARMGPAVRTCAFDYPGVGASDPSPAPITADLVASSLHSTFAVARVAPPYVLVGHSLAGLSVRAFVGRYPDEVAGVVLFDPTPVEYCARSASNSNG